MFNEMIEKINGDAKVETNKLIGELVVENKYLTVAVNELKAKLEEFANELSSHQAKEQGDSTEEVQEEVQE